MLQVVKRRTRAISTVPPCEPDDYFLSRVWSTAMDAEEPMCVICFVPLSCGSHAVCALDCAHAFHDSCLDRWGRLGGNSCPVCRTRLSRRLANHPPPEQIAPIAPVPAGDTRVPERPAERQPANPISRTEFDRFIDGFNEHVRTSDIREDDFGRQLDAINRRLDAITRSEEEIARREGEITHRLDAITRREEELTRRLNEITRPLDAEPSESEAVCGVCLQPLSFGHFYPRECSHAAHAECLKGTPGSGTDPCHICGPNAPRVNRHTVTSVPSWKQRFPR